MFLLFSTCLAETVSFEDRQASRSWCLWQG